MLTLSRQIPKAPIPRRSMSIRRHLARVMSQLADRQMTGAQHLTLVPTARLLTMVTPPTASTFQETQRRLSLLISEPNHGSQRHTTLLLRAKETNLITRLGGTTLISSSTLTIIPKRSRLVSMLPGRSFMPTIYETHQPLKFPTFTVLIDSSVPWRKQPAMFDCFLGHASAKETTSDYNTMFQRGNAIR